MNLLVALAMGAVAAVTIKRNGIAFATKAPKAGQATTSEAAKLATLLPPFRARLVAALTDLRAHGWDPFVGNTARTPEQAEKNANTCTVNSQGEKDCLGIKDSMHIYDVAADIRSKSGKKGFYEAFGAAVERQGLTWGGRWKGVNYDPGHAQGVTVAAQPAFRKMTVTQRVNYLNRTLGRA
jgi:hypothetical protein